MATKNDFGEIPQTALRVMEQFFSVMRADPDIPDDAILRLEVLLRKDALPKPDGINAALFQPPADGEK